MASEKECAVQTCERKAVAGISLCSAHRARKRKHGDVQAHIPVRDRIKTTKCSVGGCDRDRRKDRALCVGHRERVRRFGDVRADAPLRHPHGKIEGDECSVAGCARPRAEQGNGSRYLLCIGHRARKTRTGDVGMPVIRPIHSGDVREWCDYRTAHKRVRGVRGRASDLACTNCGKPAEEWSYRGGAACEFTGGAYKHSARSVWSGDPADYDPRCKECHVNFDKAA